MHTFLKKQSFGKLKSKPSLLESIFNFSTDLVEVHYTKHAERAH